MTKNKLNVPDDKGFSPGRPSLVPLLLVLVVACVLAYVAVEVVARWVRP